MRLIDADEFSKSVRELRRDFKNAPTKIWVTDVILSMLGDKLQSPTVDAKPIIHAQWAIHTKYFSPFRRCSLCGFEMGLIANEDGETGKFNYCPNCGAQMEAEV